jgi:hypothetical protein
MGVNLERLRASVNITPSRLTGGDWSSIDIAALIAGGVTAISLLGYIMKTAYQPSPIAVPVICGVGFIGAATATYTLWYLPQIIIAVLRRFWWVVLLAGMVLFVIARLYW